MSRKERLTGAGVLAIVGASFLFISRVPSLSIMNEFRIYDVAFIPYILAAIFMSAALAVSLYISPEEHLWGTDDLGCDRCKRCRARQ
jgi:hypothetical protein